MSTEIPMHPQWCALDAGHAGPCWPTPPGTPERQARDVEILTAYSAGEDVRDIAFRHGLHVLKIRDIITRGIAQSQAARDEERGLRFDDEGRAMPDQHDSGCDVLDVDPAIGRATKPCNCAGRSTPDQSKEQP